MSVTALRIAEGYDRRYRRLFRRALVASVLFHVLLFFVFRVVRPIPPSPFAAAGPRAGDDRAARGGLQVLALRVQPPTPPEVTETPVKPIPIPVPEIIPEVKVEDPKPQVAVTVANPTVATVAAASAGGTAGNATGAGTETGTGRGDGGNSEEGLFRLVPPSPRGLILPPSDRPNRLRGREIDVWVFINVRGQVVADSTRLDPASTGDRKFDDRLRKQAAEWVFEPARRAGETVAEWFRYTIVL
jgi:outer membrane biosynthesis protein TonB